MIKIRKIVFQDHPILGNLCLDFCDANGRTVDTILIAGENGCGKSTVLEALFSIASGNRPINAVVEIEKEGERIQLTFYSNEATHGQLWVKDSKGMNTFLRLQTAIRNGQQRHISRTQKDIIPGHNLSHKPDRK